MYWTIEETDILEDQWEKGMDIDKIAALLNRPRSHVKGKIDRLRKQSRREGCPRRKGYRKTLERRIQKLHAQGKSDRQMASRLGKSTMYVCRVRRELGLKPHPPTRKFWVINYRQRRKRHGSLTELRWREEYEETFLEGWPVGTTKKQAEILERLLSGATTIKTISELTGFPIYTVEALTRLMRHREWIIKVGIQGHFLLLALDPSIRRQRLDVVAQFGLAG